MKEHNDLIKKCKLLLYSISDKAIAIPIKDLDLYMNIRDNKEECIDKMLELLNRDIDRNKKE